MAKGVAKVWISLIPVCVLIILLFITIRVFGSDALNGGSQISLLIASSVCCAICIFGYGMKWQTFEKAINNTLVQIGSAIIILLLIGAISGVWMVSGVVPTLIYYGMQIIHPHYFLITTCIICCLVSVMTGSSWTTIATIGIALLGIGKAEGFDGGWIAGAIISGAYFGDKISPLSDTTVLASSMAGTPLFTHVRYMIITTVPSLSIALIIFLIAGFSRQTTDLSQITFYTDILANRFDLSLWLLIIPVVTVFMIAKKVPAIVVLFLSVIMAGLFALFFQPDILTEIAGAKMISPNSLFKGFMCSIYGSTQIETHHAEINSLLATRGMQGMLNTVWLILCATCFGACMTVSGMLRSITSLFTRFTKTRVGLVSSTITSGVFLNAVVADQYMSIILTANMYRDVYDREGYEHRLLSRSIEDSSTVTSPLIPWSSCGMTQATILNIPTLTYLPYCFFNIISPFMSIFISILGYKIYRKKNTSEHSD